MKEHYMMDKIKAKTEQTERVGYSLAADEQCKTNSQTNRTTIDRKASCLGAVKQQLY
jgi:hypothetical protein